MDYTRTNSHEPVISADTKLPEITIKAVIISIFLTILLAAANAYLGLKVGMTISASIPAAVASMGILRFFKQSNILENNIVQTAASSGEALTAGIIFTIPALIVLHAWMGFDYWTTVCIALFGGILGVFFSVPLRRALLHDKNLRFPEGTAIGNVLKASTKEEHTVLTHLLTGGGVGALISICQTGFKVLSDGAAYWFQAGGTIYGAGIGFAPALIGAGFIVGAQVGLSILFGVALGWFIGVPLLSSYYGVPDANTLSASVNILWEQHIRYVGVGVLLIGGIWALISLIKPLWVGIITSLDTLTHLKRGGGAIPRTERDIPINCTFWGILLCSIPIFVLFFFINPCTRRTHVRYTTYFDDIEQLGICLTREFYLSGCLCLFCRLSGFFFESTFRHDSACTHGCSFYFIAFSRR